MYIETSYSHSLTSQRQCVGAPAGSLVFPTGITPTWREEVGGMYQKGSRGKMLRDCSPTIYTLKHPPDLPRLFCYVVYTSYTLETASTLGDRMDCDIHM